MRATRRVIAESIVAGIVGGVLGVVVQRLLFGHTKSLLYGIIVGVAIDLLWLRARRSKTKP